MTWEMLSALSAIIALISAYLVVTVESRVITRMNGKYITKTEYEADIKHVEKDVSSLLAWKEGLNATALVKAFNDGADSVRRKGHE